MRKKLIISWALLLLVIVGNAQKPHFFVICQAKGDSSQKYAGSYERVMASYLQDYYPCASVKTQGDIENRIGMERINQLLGYESNMNFCDDLKCDYLLNLELSDFLGTQIIVSASVLFYRKAEPLVRTAKYGSKDYASIKALVNSVSETICKKLEHYEICPFTGPVNLTIESTLDSNSRLEYGVYCNEIDQRYVKEFKEKRITKSEWRLQRVGIPATNGDMSFTLDESLEINEEDGCHQCSQSKREAGRIWKSSKTFKINGEGISHLSLRNGIPQEDTRVELKFMSNGQYYLIIKGTSKPATGNESDTESAQGSCDIINPVTKQVPREVTVPVNVIFGPYPGKSTDKILTQKDTKKQRNKITNEQESISIDFTLQQ